MNPIHWALWPTFLLQMVMSFIATAGYAVLYHVPKKALVHVGLIGTGAWITQYIVMRAGVSPVGAAFAGGLFVAVASEAYARMLRMPVTVFVVGGIVPLVPGSSAYATMRQFVVGDDIGGLTQGTETFLIASAISAGLVLAGMIVRLDRRTRRDYHSTRRHSKS